MHPLAPAMGMNRSNAVQVSHEDVEGTRGSIYTRSHVQAAAQKPSKAYYTEIGIQQHGSSIMAFGIGTRTCSE